MNFSFLNEELKLLEDANLKRTLNVISTASGPWVELADGKRLMQFASNNYLGLANHPDLINATKSAASKFGVGSTGSRLLSGTLEIHSILEAKLADFESSESSMFFSSGYAANIGLMSSFLSEDDAVYSDELNHASIIDGIRLSKATKFIYKHNDMEDLQRLVNSNSLKFKKNVIVTDSVFSMNGDIANLKSIAEIATQYNCLTIVDEAHATGVYGKTGAGLVEELEMKDFFPIKIGTCSKAMGVEGGFCSGPEVLIEFLQNNARSFIFSTAPSPVIIGTILKSLELVIEGSWRREKLWNNARKLYDGLKRNHKLNLSDFSTPFIVLRFKSIETALNVSKKLFEECHVWAPVIRPPSVKYPVIRLTPIATHSEEDINYVIKAINFISEDIKLEQLV